MQGLINQVFNFIAQEENKPLYDAIKKIKEGTKKFEPSLLAPYSDPSGNPTYAYGIETNRYGKKNSISEMEMQFTKIIKEDVLNLVNKLKHEMSNFVDSAREKVSEAVSFKPSEEE